MIIVDIRIQIEGETRNVTGKLSPGGEMPCEKTLLLGLTAAAGCPGNDIQKLLADLCAEHGIAAE